MKAEQVEVLELVRDETIPVEYTWDVMRKLWAKPTLGTGNNLFSKVGIGARNMEFEIYPVDWITLHHAVRWNGYHCFVTSICKESPTKMMVAAALVRLSQCALLREEAGDDVDDLNRPVHSELNPAFLFPAVLTEKYIRYTEGTPMAQTEAGLVLVTPKSVELKVGDIVEADKRQYAVQLCHTLDEYKNEYEIVSEVDA